MPAEQASESKALKVSKSVARAFEQLQAIVYTLNRATGGSMFEILKHLSKPATDSPHSSLVKVLC